MPTNTTPDAEEYRLHRRAALSGCAALGFTRTRAAFDAAVQRAGGVDAATCLRAADCLTESVAGVFSDLSEIPPGTRRNELVAVRLGALFPR